MAYPTVNVSTVNLDVGTDNPALARTDLLDLTQKFNLLRPLPADLAAPSGSSLLGHIPDGSGAGATTVADTLKKRFVIADDFISTEKTATANVTGWAALVAYVSGLPNGAHVQASRGTYLFNGPIAQKAKMLIVGEGRQSTVFSFSHAGDGIQSTWPINSSTAVWSGVRDMAFVSTNVASTGGGFVDVGGSYIDLYNVYSSGFKYGIVFDQTEISSIEKSELISGDGNVGIWLVNGADHTAGASPGFTNRIVINDNQLNASANSLWNIQNDGGGSHTITNNNFNGGLGGVRIAGAAGVILTGNECEGHTQYPIFLTDTTLSGTYRGPVQSPIVEVNTISDATAGSHVYLDAVVGGSVSHNAFGQSNAGNIVFPGGIANKTSGVNITGNSKIVIGAFRQAGPFVSGWGDIFYKNIITQAAQSYSVAGYAAGTQMVTPASMEAINIGTRLWCINADGTNGELVTVSSTTATTFTSTFATSKAAYFVFYSGISDDHKDGGTWVPALTGSGPTGGATMTVQSGTYSVIGSKCFINMQITWTALTGGAAGQPTINLPIKARAATTIPALISGPTAVGPTTIFFMTATGSTSAGALYVNASTGALNLPSIGVSGTIYLNGCYDI